MQIAQDKKLQENAWITYKELDARYTSKQTAGGISERNVEYLTFALLWRSVNNAEWQTNSMLDTYAASIRKVLLDILNML